MSWTSTGSRFDPARWPGAGGRGGGPGHGRSARGGAGKPFVAPRDVRDLVQPDHGPPLTGPRVHHTPSGPSRPCTRVIARWARSAFRRPHQPHRPSLEARRVRRHRRATSPQPDDARRWVLLRLAALRIEGWAPVMQANHRAASATRSPIAAAVRQAVVAPRTVERSSPRSVTGLDAVEPRAGQAMPGQPLVQPERRVRGRRTQRASIRSSGSSKPFDDVEGRPAVWRGREAGRSSAAGGEPVHERCVETEPGQHVPPGAGRPNSLRAYGCRAGAADRRVPPGSSHHRIPLGRAPPRPRAGRTPRARHRSAGDVEVGQETAGVPRRRRRSGPYGPANPAANNAVRRCRPVASTGATPGRPVRTRCSGGSFLAHRSNGPGPRAGQGRTRPGAHHVPTPGAIASTVAERSTHMAGAASRSSSCSTVTISGQRAWVLTFYGRPRRMPFSSGRRRATPIHAGWRTGRQTGALRPAHRRRCRARGINRASPGTRAPASGFIEAGFPAYIPTLRLHARSARMLHPGRS